MTSSPTDHVLPLAGLLNLRDLGGYPTVSGGQTLTHRLLRSDDLGRMAPDGRPFLLDYGLRTVVDLRDPEELQALPDPFAESDQVRYCWLPFFDDSGRRMGPPDLTQSKGQRYLRWFEVYPANVAAIFRTLAGIKDGVTLFHCVAGKDRTGLVAAMILSLAGVADPLIDADYAASFELLKPWTDQLRADAERKGEDMASFERRAQTFPETMQEVLDGFRSKYGGIAAYLRQVGLTDAEIASLETRLLE